MIGVNSRVIIGKLDRTRVATLQTAPIMLVEGLYYISISGRLNVKATAEKVTPDSAKCVWYDSENRLQTEFIDLDILTEE